MHADAVAQIPTTRHHGHSYARPPSRVAVRSEARSRKREFPPKMMESSGEITREHCGHVHFCCSAIGAPPIRKAWISQMPLGQDAGLRQPRCASGRRGEDSSQALLAQLTSLSSAELARLWMEASDADAVCRDRNGHRGYARRCQPRGGSSLLPSLTDHF